MARRAQSYRGSRRSRELSEVTGDDDILQEAKDRHKRSHAWESNFQKLFQADTKFVNGDSDNGWQWPDQIKEEREVNKRPTLTVNKVFPMCSLVINDFKRNKPGVKVKPIGDKASFKSAQAREGVVRHIEYRSNAHAIYDEVHTSQVEGGIGYCRLVTDYVEDDNFDQDIFLKPIRDQLGVLLDCDIEQKDGSDAKYGFIVTTATREQFDIDHPDLDYVPGGSGVLDGDNWVGEDEVRIAEYYRIVETSDELIYMQDPPGENGQIPPPVTFRMSEAPRGAKKKIQEAQDSGLGVVKRRKLKLKSLEWYKIVGDHIVDRRKLKGQYVPILRAPGVERIIAGKLERKGMVRALKDAQRMYNYNTSGQVEYGALATKTPWVGPEEAFSGNPAAWNNANKSNAAYLTYKHRDKEGEPLPAPARPEAPGASPAFLEGMKIAAMELEMASGQQTGQRPNPAIERTPAAINSRVRISDTATYHFADNMAVMIRHAGVVILDMMPHYYDTKRIIQILGRDGTQTKLQVDPDAEEAYDEAKTMEGIEAIFNPKIGKYEVESDVGPSYGTQRQEAWDAFVNIVTGAPDLINEIGDLMFRSADFPLADKIAERLHRKIKQQAPYLLSDDPATNPMVQQLQQEIKAQSEQVAELLQELARYRLKLIGKENKYDIQAFDALSKRITAITNAWPEVSKMEGGDAQLKRLVTATMMEMLHDADITEIVDQTQEGGAQPEALGGQNDPMAQAQRSPIDGKLYVPDPRRPGKHLRVREEDPMAEHGPERV